jgi:hypothetical protein
MTRFSARTSAVKYSIPASMARSLRRASSAEPSPRRCHASTTVTPTSAVSGWSGSRMKRHSPTMSGDSSGTATSASWSA